MEATRKVRTAQIQEEWSDSDGYWIALKPGWCNAFEPGCHTIHEDTRSEAYDVPIEKCECGECLQEMPA